MKKIILCFCIVLTAFSLVSFKKYITTNNVEVTIYESSKFTEEEINKAIACVQDNFTFPACTLTNIWYDEEKSNSFIEDYLENGPGAINGVTSENVIVLLSTFYVDASGDNPVLNADSTYTDYNSVLIRDNKRSDWKIDSQGY